MTTSRYYISSIAPATGPVDILDQGSPWGNGVVCTCQNRKLANEVLKALNADYDTPTYSQSIVRALMLEIDHLTFENANLLDKITSLDANHE